MNVSQTSDGRRQYAADEPAVKRVLVQIDPDQREFAESRGYDVQPFEAELLPGCPWMFWHRVRPLSGRHTVAIDLPPMFQVTSL